MSKQKLRDTVRKINKIIDLIFNQQINDGNKGVYPQGFDKEQVSINDIDQYSCLRESKDSYIQYGYNILYKKEFEQIVVLLDEYLDKNSYQKEYLEEVKRGFLENDWCSLERSFLNNVKSLNHGDLLWNIGPIESMSDNKMGIHRYFSSLMCKVINQGDSIDDLLNNIDEFSKTLSVQGFIKPKTIKIVIAGILSQAGEIANIDPSGWSRPEDVLLAQSHGTVKQIYRNNVFKKNKDYYQGVAVAFYGRTLGEKVVDFMKKNYLIMISLHEYSHTLGKFEGYRDILGENYNIIEEIKAEYISLLIGNYLEKRGILFKGFFQYMILTDFVVCAHMRKIYKTSGTREPYYYLCSQFCHSLHRFIQSKNGCYNMISDEHGVLREIRKTISSIMNLCKKGSTKQVETFVSRVKKYDKESYFVEIDSKLRIR